MEASIYSKWQKATKSDVWNSLSDNQKELAKQQFVEKYSKADSPETSEAYKLVNSLALRPLEEVINDPQFLERKEDFRKKIIKANLIASGQATDDDFKPADFNKDALRYIKKTTKGDELVNDTYFSKINKPAAMAGAAAPFKAAAQAVGAIGVATGIGGEETFKNASDSINADAPIKARDPNRALGAELLANIPAAVVSGGGFIARLLTNVGLAAATMPVEGKDKTAEDVLVSKGVAGGVAGIVGVAGELATSPAVVNKGRSLINTLKSPFSKGAREATIGRELATEVSTPVIDTIRQELNAEAVSKGIAPDKISDYTTKRIASPEIQKRIANETSGILTSQQSDLMVGDSVYTPAAANSPELQRVQREAGNLDDILETTIKKRIPEYTKKVSKEIDALKTAGVIPPDQAQVAPLSLHVYKKYVAPKVGNAAATLESSVKKINDAFTTNQTAIMKTARQGALAAPSGVTAGSIKKDFDSIIEKYPVLKDNLEADTFKILDRLSPKPVKGSEKASKLFVSPTESVDVAAKGKVKGGLDRDLTLEEIRQLQQSLADDMKGSGSASQGFEEMFGVLNSKLGASTNQTMKQLSDLGTAHTKAMAETRAILSKEGGIDKNLSGKPILKAFASGQSANKIVDAAIAKGVTLAEVKEVLNDKVTADALRGAVLADISDTLSLGSGKLDVEAFAARYADSQEVVKEIFKGNKELTKVLDEIYSTGKQTNIATSFAAPKTGIGIGQGKAISKSAAAGFAEATGARSMSAGLAGNVVERTLHAQTLKLLRDSVTDKYVAIKLYDAASKYTAGTLKYRTLWDKGQGYNLYTGIAAREAGKRNPIDVGTGEPIEDGIPYLEDIRKANAFTSPPVPQTETVPTEPAPALPAEQTPAVKRLKTSGIIDSEGVETLVYDEGAGKDVVKTVGIGFNMDSGIAKAVWRKAGIDKSFESVYNGEESITEDEAVKLAETSLQIAETDAKLAIPNYNNLDEKRQDAILHLSYQLGGPRLRGFKAFKQAIANQDFKTAAREVLNSEMAKQTPSRARKVAELLSENSTTQRVQYDKEGRKVG